MRPFLVADLFCGAGGTSTGLLLAARELGLRVDLLAVNHWPVAIETHTKNHPSVRHLCADVEGVDPRQAVPGGRLDLLIASPECTHHSTARGGRPVTDQKRASAWHVLRWAEHLYVENILIENVPEFRSWGPIGLRGRPLKAKRGETYQAFLAALRSLGYRVEDGILNAADYGDPTTRRRLFIRATRGKGPLLWPQPTHSRKPSLFGLKSWRPARGVIDWSLQGKSIFDRKRPLAPATMARIMEGLDRFGGPELKPFLVVLRRNQGGRSLDEPMPTLTCSGAHLALCEPFVLGQQSGSVPRNTEDPLPTVATDGAIGLVQPYLVPLYGERYGQGPRTHGIDEPVPTIPASGGGKFGVVEPFLLHLTHSGRERSIDDPLPTVTSAHRGELGVVEPFLTQYNGTGGAVPVDAPLPTLTTKDRIALVMPVVNGRALDIRFRMLQPHELSAAMGFPQEYEFVGNREERVKQIGNAVCVNLAMALCRTVLEQKATRPRAARRTA